MVDRPENFVTREMDAKRTSAIRTELAPPEVPKEIVEWLEALRPARCYEPASESLEAHLLYAGEVRLVQFIRATYDRQVEDGIDTRSVQDRLIDAIEENSAVMLDVLLDE